MALTVWNYTVVRGTKWLPCVSLDKTYSRVLVLNLLVFFRFLYLFKILEIRLGLEIVMTSIVWVFVYIISLLLRAAVFHKIVDKFVDIEFCLQHVILLAKHSAKNCTRCE